MNRELTIAVGKSRFETNRKNKKMYWDDLVKRLRQTTRTKETYAEYLKMPKDRMDQIKDIGGFVGGAIRGGRRVSGSIISRSLLTLDIDNASEGFWDDFSMLNEWTCCVYSTHKHRPDAPRLRLVAPLDRDVTAEEYEAIARKIAELIGIDQMDDSTYQPTRLMYWPSTAADAEFFFRQQTGDWLSADEVLASYADWHDISQWPMSSREKQIRPGGTKKHPEDPTAKEGLIGVFCRAYSVTAAIDHFLPEIYTPAGGNRYTYLQGSTSKGLVIYDDLWAYSNHATDPAAMKLCNAYDLVRIHLFGNLDSDTKEGTPVNRLPSARAMGELILEDPECRTVMNRETAESARSDFAEISPEEEDLDWMNQLKRTPKGALDATIDNIYLILQHDPNLKNLGGYDEFNYRYESFGPLPWDPEKLPYTNWTDADDGGLRMYLEKHYALYARDKTVDAVNRLFNDNRFHPVRDYLEALEWDGMPRLDRVLIDYLGAEDNAYTRAVTRKALAAAVARVYEPGCKFDYMPVLIGRQGIGKSTLLQKLGRHWFSDTMITVSGKDAYDQLQGCWIIEMSELTATRKADVEAVKQFISKRVDTYRQAYARRTGVFPRQCIFIGTTNDTEFLRDRTGNRRYWPVDTGSLEPAKDVFDGLNDDEIDQIWAEAKYRYKLHEPLYLSAELAEMAIRQQEEHTEDDTRIGMIAKYLNRKLPKNWNDMNRYERRTYITGDEFGGNLQDGTEIRQRVCAREIAFECLRIDNPTKAETREINQIMERMEGWIRIKNPRDFGDEYGNQRGFQRVERVEDRLQQ